MNGHMKLAFLESMIQDRTVTRYRAEVNAMSTMEASFTPQEVHDCLAMNAKLTGLRNSSLEPLLC